MSAQIAQLFTTVDCPSDASNRVSMEYLIYCHHMGVSGNRFATNERGVNVRGIN
jgi:hypothetical protein